MDMGAAILDFLKALIWPVVILIIVLMFKSHLDRILRHLPTASALLKK
jgi:hypothetical protein